MRLQELIEKTEDIIKTDSRKRKKKKKYLKKIMKDLREYEEELEEKFKSGYGNTEKISQELALIHAQRKKGLIQLRQLHEEKKKKKQNAAEIKEDNDAM